MGSSSPRFSSYRNGLESSLVLARAHLREVQFLIENADWGEHNDAEDEDLTEEQQANKKRLQGHFEAGLSPIQRAIAGNLVLRRQLGSLPAMQALENSRLFYFGDMEELYWNEMGLEMDKSRITRDPEPLLVAIQKWKAVSLRDTISRRLKYDTPAPESVAYGQPWSSNVNIPETLYPVIEPPEFEEKLIWGMAEIAEAHLEAGQSIVFVDWTRYYDTLFMVAYDGTEGRIKKAVLEIDYHAIETWVHSELGVSSLHQGRTNRKRLHKSSRLKDLRPILEKLEGPRSLLVLKASFTSGEEATRDVFMNRSRGTRLLHYHGHAYLEAAQRRDRALQLEPRKATMDLPQNDGLLTVMDIFDLKLDSAVVVLLACASGEDDVAPNDDPLGLLSAFLYAGASSVIATRWPTQTSDARDFAETFYQKAFSSRKDGTVNLALAVQAAVLELWENWDEDDPYHWAQFQLRRFLEVIVISKKIQMPHQADTYGLTKIIIERAVIDLGEKL
ncbi:putative Tetratricopeptide repeat protein 28 [Glarea lozoyensis 74030]|uniref:Putative Tetratricopeptide repeat protein 28 n=1 Tax=Glarea lozoyensis (strain ATCC 74030 / MF5533) TaxID=1104152 RepID=H0ECB3_GLAL7|nr:putative Tetratricopeptide repeat protein 28 [Glarea lozoyensis 74030]